jgi:hypothetical protein
MPNNKDQKNQNWVTTIYTPEGSERLGHNRPISTTLADESVQQTRTVAEVIAEANRNSAARP